MFEGREHELTELNRLYNSGGFQMVVLYGRRRVGKTTLALEFAKDKPSLFFTAKVQSDALNLADFSRVLYAHFGLPVSTGAFASWDDAFSFLATNAGERGLVFMFDEFPYAAAKCSSLVSSLQIAIDRHFSSTNIFMILTGSNQGFMEERVLVQLPWRTPRSALARRTRSSAAGLPRFTCDPLGIVMPLRCCQGFLLRISLRSMPALAALRTISRLLIPPTRWSKTWFAFSSARKACSTRSP